MHRGTTIFYTFQRLAATRWRVRVTFLESYVCRSAAKAFTLWLRGVRTGLVFKVFAQTTIPTEPAEAALDHPATRQDLEALGACGPAYDLQRPTEMLLDPVCDIFIRAVCPDQLQATPAIVG